MRLAFFGDVMGRSGRQALEAHLPRLRRRLALDFIVINAENSAGGFGVTQAICEDLFDLGCDVVTTGNHAYDQRDSLDIFDSERRLLRPANFPASNPGRGSGLYQTKDGRHVAVIHVQGQRFMNPIDDPVPAVEREMDGMQMGREADAILVDMHAETTSEKYSLGHYLDGRVSLVVGTHTHIPTADTHIMPGGTAFQCDAGMCGDYDSVIGMEKSGPVQRFTDKLPGPRLQPASGEGTVCGILVITDDKTGLALSAEPIRVGGRLAETIPAPAA